MKVGFESTANVALFGSLGLSNPLSLTRSFTKMPRHLENWPDLVKYAAKLDDVDPNDERALFYRERNSHRGISEFSKLRKLKARMVNQEFLEEICRLENLTFLSLQMVTAVDLSSLNKLPRLKVLIIDSPRNVKDFRSLANLRNLQGLYTENAKHLISLEFLSDAHRLTHIGVEGSMWTNQKIASLSPLRGLKSMQFLSLTSVQLLDKDLSYLSNCPALEELICARLAPKLSFDHLRQLMPNLKCHWCDDYEIGSFKNN